MTKDEIKEAVYEYIEQVEVHLHRRTQPIYEYEEARNKLFVILEDISDRLDRGL